MELIHYLFEEKAGSIGEVWYGGAVMEHPMVSTTMNTLKERGVKYRQIRVDEDETGERPHKLEIDGVELLVYGPNRYDVENVNDVNNIGGANNVSLVFRFQFGETVFLTSGDIYRLKEEDLLDTYGPEPFKADVIKMNHHGNFQSNMQAWIEATRPKIAYAEADGNGNSDVARRYREAGADCYCTGVDGMLHITMGQQKDITIYHQYER
jgi:beta-lactamase superfamily II metal-dependent hydrolase